jgi:hypothetical protein
MNYYYDIYFRTYAKSDWARYAALKIAQHANSSFCVSPILLLQPVEFPCIILLNTRFKSL